MKKAIQLRLRDRIKALRQEKEYTQERLAELAGIDYKHIQLLESKDPPAARIDTIERLASAFKMRIADFLDL